MSADLGYGPRLSDEEYDRAIVTLHEKLPAMPTREEDRTARRTELDLAIDHRLGRRFPQAKRDALWQVVQRVERRRLRLIGRHLVSRVLPFGRRERERAGQGLAGVLVEQFSQVLSDRELESFFELAGSPPSLPVDAKRSR
jgi:hypothetical protein